MSQSCLLSLYAVISVDLLEVAECVETIKASWYWQRSQLNGDVLGMPASRCILDRQIGDNY
jgi:hypothetical protein